MGSDKLIRIVFMLYFGACLALFTFIGIGAGLAIAYYFGG